MKRSMRLLIIGLSAVALGLATTLYGASERQALGGIWSRAVFGAGGIVVMCSIVPLLFAFLYWREGR